ncbi:hypothetical protein G4V62_13690 [Bacillaceae bacterium SIJ1]|uniref:M60 family metallopeptidase n=1 Tax=Litoribacterium kuwaitense TaxID=1398745 RepID=UPI0013EB5F1D|nr:M60 family metallopeptidase [Litoribacterium kuwaitense]NGP45947.1 hypothetical protein [Litoribacterium kuwaitense]
MTMISSFLLIFTLIFPTYSLASAPDNKTTITLQQNGTIDDERERLKVSFGPSYYQPTGRYVSEGQEITVTVHKANQSVLPRLVISPPILNEYAEGRSEGIELKPGVNKMTASESGILYLINESEPTNQPAQVTINGADIIPTFELGNTTLAEWQQSLEDNATAPVFELVSSKVMITADISFAEMVSDPEELLEAHDEVVDIEAEVSGLSPNASSLHRTTDFRYHYRQTQEEGYWMYAWFNHTAYAEEAMQYVLDLNLLKTDGWGPWHELGHVHQQYPWTPGMFTEVTTNIFSLTVQEHFGQPSRLEADGVYDRAFEFLEEPSRDYADLGVFEKLVMFWQLDLAYGDDFYPTFFKQVRETPESELPQTNEEKIQQTMVWASEAARQNLIPFFEEWGLSLTDETKDDIVDLGFPELEAEIWKNTDSNNTIEPNPAP